MYEKKFLQPSAASRKMGRRSGFILLLPGRFRALLAGKDLD